ncbi:hypothetical protein ACB094_04G001900 [Castanea mollissima]
MLFKMSNHIEKEGSIVQRCFSILILCINIQEPCTYCVYVDSTLKLFQGEATQSTNYVQSYRTRREHSTKMLLNSHSSHQYSRTSLLLCLCSFNTKTFSR